MLKTTANQIAKSSYNYRADKNKVVSVVCKWIGACVLSVLCAMNIAYADTDCCVAGSCNKVHSNIRACRKAAQQGDAVGQFALAGLYEMGNYIKQDKKKANYLFQKALKGLRKRSDPLAYYCLADFYYAKQDRKAAEAWYEKAFKGFEKLAKQGDRKAQFYLANLYEHYRDDKDIKEKFLYWYQKSANQGYANAQYTLAGMYLFAQWGVDSDSDKAVYWFTKAAKQGHSEAQYYLASIYYPSKESENWYEKALKQEDEESTGAKSIDFLQHNDGI